MDALNTVCEVNQCAGCMACVDICPKSCISIKDDIEHMNAVIDENACIHCNACHRVCQKNHPAELQKPIAWYQGWAVDEIRNQSSSGGFASAIQIAFIKNGGVVASCKLVDGDYKFIIARTIDELSGFAGSKYVKSNPVGIYKKVREELRKGNKVLFIGLPCQVSAMKNFIGNSLGKNLYSIDLICHGTPSIKLFRMALNEYGYDLKKCKYVYFRRNGNFAVRTDLKKIVPERCHDFYTQAFLQGIDYTENCYSCHYATDHRVGDLMLGDSWGSELHDEEQNGISLALVQNEKGNELLSLSGVTLKPVDLENAKIPNTQLRHPTPKSPEHDVFFQKIAKGKSFRSSVTAVWPKFCMKENLKLFLINAQSFPGGDAK
ncbi:Coenzyme F420 hydrogenase/dehydrogenase, beta subunit C-terminal domain [Stecheria sp. CLA-KB-P133]|uniref:Coenzyme F420 hydrogenase/dehydrogenase, beta subunit C-terminal domain n=1 Tax=Grylomicrobium aquisgranensis TaxID=2926318 RepID=A0AB35U4J2_9FIRM|nr:Coenzyme F420 hydrogenase/dehydrogenase, beta subunit C-terminal domain [Stecheria sp. CLA-KB-P133]